LPGRDPRRWIGSRRAVDENPAFVDEPAFDASSATYAVQLSVPVSDAGKRIGALTLTLKVRKDATAPAR